MSGPYVTELRVAALAYRRRAKDLPRTDSDREQMIEIADASDKTADEIEALTPAMRADLEAMMAGIRRQ